MAEHIKIISIGAAVQDVFLSGKVLKAVRGDSGEWVEEFPLGAKLDLDNIVFSTGGGATNGSVTFARQGMKSYFMGKIGHDPAGEAVLSDLTKEDVNISHVSYSKKFSTGYSTLLLAPRGERTILTYRGASTHFRIENFDFDNARADWFFITSLSGNMTVIEHAVRRASLIGAKVALIPGKGELKNAKRLKSLLKNVHILSANKEEMQMLFKGESKEDLALAAAKHVDVAVVTDGPKGVAACDGKKLCVAGMYEDVPVIDRTGAGDAFASGFTAKIAQGKSLEKAIIFASANSTSVVSYVGAKKGILHSNSRVHDMDIKTKIIAEE